MKHFILKILTIVFIIFGLIYISNIKNSTIIKNNEKMNFINIIKNYQSFNYKYIDLYYNEYKQNNNIINILNKINHPDYYKKDIIKKAPILNQNILLINKKYYIDDSYKPTNLQTLDEVSIIKRENETMYLEQECYNSYKKLYNLSKQYNLNLTIYSAYRSIDKQTYLYNLSKNNQLVAKPGHSEHHCGQSIDIATINSGLTIHFEYTNEFKFLNEFAHEYGFILRYPKNKSDITGYDYEPWHYRYVGKEHAKIIKANNLTLEEYIYTYLEIL